MAASPGPQDAASAAAIRPENENLPDNVSAYPVPPLDYFARYFSDPVAQDRTSFDDVTSDLVNGDLDEVAAPAPPRAPSPPPIPPDLSVEAFGCLLTPTDHVMRELEEQGIDRLGAAEPKKHLLRQLMWSSIAKFFEILECLIRDPHSERRLELTADLQTIFINMHHTVNKYRRPQGEASLEELLKFQAKRSVKQADFLLDNMTTALDLLENAEGAASSDGGMSSTLPAAVVVDGVDTGEFRREVASLQRDVEFVRIRSENLAERNFTAGKDGS